MDRNGGSASDTGHHLAEVLPVRGGAAVLPDTHQHGDYLHSDARPDPHSDPSPTPPAGITTTTTTLQVAPNPGYSFIPEILIARVSPFNAVGTVQFFDGNTNVRTNLGDAVPVMGGIAMKFATLPKGNHTLTAVFNPANTFLSSVSSPISLTVRSLFGGLGF